MEYIVETKRSEIVQESKDSPAFFEERIYYIFCPLCGARLYGTGDFAELDEDGSLHQQDGENTCVWELTTEELIQEDLQQTLRWHYTDECPCYTEHLDEY